MAKAKPNIIVNTIWSSFQRFGGMIISFVANIVLARLLCPEDFGMVAMVYVFVGIANVLVEGGFGSSLIQKKEPSQEDISTVFTTNFVISFVLFLAIVLGAGGIESFTIPGIRLYLQVEALQIILRAFYIVPHSMLTKQLEYKKIAIYHIVASIISLAGAILLAFAGFGIWSLIIKNLLLDAMLLFLYLSNGRRYLHFGFNMGSFKELFGFGAFITLYNLLETLYTNTVAFLIGKRYSVKDLGYYNQAYSLQQIPVYSVSDVLNNILFPYFSAIQNEEGRVHRLMKASIEATSFFVFPLLFYLITFSDKVIILLYSDKWVPCVPYFRIFCVMGFFTTLININRSALKSKGLSRTIFIIQSVSVIIGISLLLFGMRYSLMMAVSTFVINSLLLFLVIGIITGKLVGYKLFQQCKDCFMTAALSLVCSILTYYVLTFFHVPVLVFLILAAVVYASSYLCLNYLFKTNSFATVRLAVNSVKNNRNRK